MAMEEGIGTNPVSGKVNKYTHNNRILIYQLKFEKKYASLLIIFVKKRGICTL